ncbi:hypothetical protein AVEN_144504-1 [Araneus ventricosus]|uniref:Uncharacterized protein n=1 Tax=Araneus ventricosus TaxID=182803 RepID=A0A4Y2W633_ARAVE|nr:hypothetical protein AVEN_144504-1 [Araneus ventricosus]
MSCWSSEPLLHLLLSLPSKHDTPFAPIFSKAKELQPPPPRLHRSNFSIYGPTIEMECLESKKIGYPNFQPHRFNPRRIFALMSGFRVERNVFEGQA